MTDVEKSEEANKEYRGQRFITVGGPEKDVERREDTDAGD